jgi:hypothetical protein
VLGSRLGVMSPSCPGGKTLRWRNFFTLDKEESVIAWAWQTYTPRRERYLAAMADPENSHLRFVRLTTPAAARRFLSGVDQL